MTDKHVEAFEAAVADLFRTDALICTASGTVIPGAEGVRPCPECAWPIRHRDEGFERVVVELHIRNGSAPGCHHCKFPLRLHARWCNQYLYKELWQKPIPTFRGPTARAALTARLGLPNAAPTDAEVREHGQAAAAIRTRRVLFVDDTMNGAPVAYWEPSESA